MRQTVEASFIVGLAVGCSAVILETVGQRDSFGPTLRCSLSYLFSEASVEGSHSSTSSIAQEIEEGFQVEAACMMIKQRSIMMPL